MWNRRHVSDAFDESRDDRFVTLDIILPFQVDVFMALPLSAVCTRQAVKQAPALFQAANPSPLLLLRLCRSPPFCPYTHTLPAMKRC